MFDAKIIMENHPRLYLRYYSVGIVLLTGLIGGAVPFYVGAMGDKLSHLMVLPALILLGFLLIFNRVLLLLLILLFRASGDLILATTKFNLAGISIGIGGLINAFMILIALSLVIEKPGVVPNKIFTMWSFYLLIGLYGLFIAPSKADAIRMYLGAFSNFAVFVSSFYVIGSKGSFGSCIRIILWSSAIPVIYALLDFLFNGAFVGTPGFRLKSTFAHPNIFAFYLILIISFTLYILKSSKYTLSTMRRSALSLYMTLLLALLLLTQTRSAWAACFTLFLMYGFFFQRRYLLYLILMLFLALLIPSVQERLLELGSGNEVVQYAKLNSFAWRLLMWESGLKWMKAGGYLLGYGGESFSYYSMSFFPLSNGTPMGAHNVFVQLFFELGIVGVSAFLWLFLRILHFLRPMFLFDRLAGLTIVFLVIAYLMLSISDNLSHYLVFNWYFWFIIGSALAAALHYQKQTERHPESAKFSLATPFNPGFSEVTEHVR